ncbi:DoxX family protein [Flavobacterium sp. CBA20B-1]|uniref:DoxX family protein n=1 Tax=unclassified Flavobacterium TaxID=196869 RepID=UPI0022251F6A|nr:MULTISPECIES: DoxX family protein [unclassified Flavobacterium]WCM41107.1 DoxX family protein [Flavobacterium sp. CBA20B-1]
MNHITEILILLFLAITFLQSGYDKMADWNGNVGWLKSHFANTFLGNKVPFSLGIILILEIIAGILALAGIWFLTMNDNKEIALYSGIVSCITLLFLLFGQRIAKDYDGARTIVIYMIPALFLVFLLK